MFYASLVLFVFFLESGFGSFQTLFNKYLLTIVIFYVYFEKESAELMTRFIF